MKKRWCFIATMMAALCAALAAACGHDLQDGEGGGGSTSETTTETTVTGTTTTTTGTGPCILNDSQLDDCTLQ